MPTITYDKKDLLSLIGKNLKDEEIDAVISQIKDEVGEISTTEVTVELEPERPDLFGIEGLARCIKGLIGTEIGMKKYVVAKSNINVEIKNAKTRPFIGVAIIKNVSFTDASIKSIMNVQEVLHATIGNKRSKVAVGIHDLSKISLTSPIVYTDVPLSHKMVPLGATKEMTLSEILKTQPKGIEYAHLIKDQCPAFIDSQGIFSFPPILNSERTKVNEKTTDLFIDVTGTDERAVKQTLNIIVTNLAERGCIIESVSVDGKEMPDLSPEIFIFDPKLVKKLIGIDLKNEEIVEMLKKERYDAKIVGEKIEVCIPAYRIDILHSVDLAEDIAIAYNYKNISPLLPNVFTVGKLSKSTQTIDKLRNIVYGFGLQEVRTMTLTSEKQQNGFGLNKKLVKLENPMSEEYNCVRGWITPSLIAFLSKNKHADYPQNIFEVGLVAETNREWDNFACALTDSKITFNDARALLESILREMGIKAELKASEYNFLIPGRSADVYVSGKKVGFIGELHPAILNQFGLELPVAIFEIEAYLG